VPAKSSLGAAGEIFAAGPIVSSDRAAMLALPMTICRNAVV
jgi:hypothetical protein